MLNNGMSPQSALFMDEDGQIHSLIKLIKDIGSNSTGGNFTPEEKKKLANIEENANNYVHPENHEPSIITQDATHRFVTDAEKTAWSSKAEGNHEHNQYVTFEQIHSHENKSVLDGINQGKIDEWDSKASSGHSHNNYGSKSEGNTWTNNNKFSGGVVLEKNDEVQRIQPSNTNNACYFGFYKNKNNRTGHFGYASSSDNNITLANDVNNANIDFKTKGEGKIRCNNIPIATETYVNNQVSNIVNSAPETLNTLNELAEALGNDANFATTVSNQIGTKASTEYVNAELNKKVNLEGYVATENSYTTVEKIKLQGIEENANNYIHPAKHNPNEIKEDETHRFITDIERQKWNNKSDFDGDYEKLTNKPNIPSKTSQLVNDSNYVTITDLNNKVDKEEGKVLSSNDYTTNEKNKLNGIAENANNYVHPDNHNAMMITQDETHRFVTDTERQTWNNKSDGNHNHDNTYATKSSEHSHANKIVLDTITTEKIQSWDNKSDFNGSYNDLKDKPTIPTVDVTKNYVDTQLATKSNIHEHPYLSEDTVIPTRVSELENDSNFMTSIPSEYITESELNNKGYITNEAIENKADKSELHEHTNKSILDGITDSNITQWNKSIPFENTTINNANDWKTFGYKKTSNNTTNLPPQCTTSADKWGILQFIKESDQGTGTQLFYPIDGTYKGRIFVRSVLKNAWGEWTLLSTFSGSYNDLTNKPTSFTPSMHRHNVSEIDGLDLESIQRELQAIKTDLGNSKTILQNNINELKEVL